MKWVILSTDPNKRGKQMPTLQTLSRLAIAALLITTMTFSALYIDLAIKHDQLAEDYTNISK